jgi:hypothetical protein
VTVKDILEVVIPVLLMGGAFMFAVSVWHASRALGRRIRRWGERADPAPLSGDLRAELLEGQAGILGEVETLRREVADLAERVDFAERLLAKQRESERLAPPR